MPECREGGCAGAARAEELFVRCPSEKQWRGQSFAGIFQSVFSDAVCRN